MGLLEMHCHLLPSIDDGYVAKEDFLRMMGIYRESGFSTIVFTPHLYNPYVTTHIEQLRETYAWAEKAAATKGITTYLGSELYVNQQASLNALAINDRYVLVEFGLALPPKDLLLHLTWLTDRSLAPIIAHVERYLWLSPQAPLLTQMKNLGCLLQCNVEAVENGSAAAYLEAGLVDIIASDNHGDETLAPRLAQAIAAWPDVGSKMEQLL